MSMLAIQGGPKVRTEPFPAYRTVGQEEKDALAEVIDSGILSGFLGAWHDKFHGGVKVREVEKAWQEFFHVKHAITVNSNSSGLIAAMGAARIGPGDEVIVAPNSTSISATAPLFYGGILCVGSHNLSYSHCDRDLDMLAMAQDEAMAVVKGALQKGNIRKRLLGDPIQPVFQLR